MNLPRWTAYVALAVVATLLVSAIPRKRGEPARPRAVAASEVEHPRVVVLGIDGMDPDILQDVMDRYPEGMANFRRLAAAGGGVGALGTSYPPQRPVADGRVESDLLRAIGDADRVLRVGRRLEEERARVHDAP